MSPIPLRKEKDSLGVRRIPKNVPWGIFTERAKENFQVSNHKGHPTFLFALALIKKASAETNGEIGLLPKKLSRAICRAADEVLNGNFTDAFPIDTFQAGAGTPFNMNMNEVLANRANEFFGKKKGTYAPIHPNDHVNKCQSTNDVIPTALRIAALALLKDYENALKKLEQALQKKARAFAKIVKSGRTHLADAVPITLGQEFESYAATIEEHIMRLHETRKKLARLSIGGTAVGTGINTSPRYRPTIIKKLRRLTGIPLVATKNLMYGAQSGVDFADAAGMLKLLAIDLNRITNDLRLLASGPATGLNEIYLPEVEPGSSIMPGKINPSILEMVNMVCYHVMGNAYAIDQASGAGQLELNVMNPMIAHNLLEAIEILTNAMNIMEKKCIRGIRANNAMCRYYLEKSPAAATALTPEIGYTRAAELVKESMRTGKTVRELALHHKLLPKKRLDRILDFHRLTKPNL